MKRRGPWKIVESHPIYRDPWIDVHKDDVIRPDGRPGTYSVVHLKPGVSVLALDESENVFLTEEFHYGVGRTTLEVVSGGIDPGHDALATAQRELQEEIGIEATDWTELGLVDPFTANVVSPTQLYLARNLRFVACAPEGTEVIRRVEMPLAEAVENVINSKITHGPSCVAILKAWLFVRREKGDLA
jgi:ADP-ribose pyrophosphatase